MNFALITEGITDQVALEAIIKGHYKKIDPDIEIEVNFVQPFRDKTDQTKQGNFAGWELVFEACATDNTIEAALNYNDYLIIQIDTDVGEHENFGLSLSKCGVDIDIPTLINETEKIVSAKFGDRWEGVSTKVIMAISIHSLECWILALHETAATAKTKNCEQHLSTLLARQNKGFKKDYKTYRDICSEFKKPKSLIKAQDRNASLKAFTEKLPAAI